MPPISRSELGLPVNFFPNVIETGFTAIDECHGNLYDEEFAAVRRAVAKRRNEFTAGRETARAVLARLGIEACPILVGKNREPLWPDGAIGSISHDGNLCIAVAARKQDIALLGIDLTMRTSLEGDVVRLICSDEEFAAAQSIASRLAFDPCKLIFSVKESVYKCLFPVVQKVFDFECVSVSLDVDADIARVTLLDRSLFSDRLCALSLTARFCCFGDYIFTAVWVERQDWSTAVEETRWSTRQC